MSYKAVVLFGAFIVATIGPVQGAHAVTNTVTTQCGAPIDSTVLTDTTPNTGTHHTTFLRLSGARAVIVVPAGPERCVDVRFDASASCKGAPTNNLCYVEVIDNEDRTNPSSEILFATDSEFPATHSFEWVKRLAPGSHTIAVQIRVTDTQTHFVINGWTMNIEVTN
jgi:hypothetical protein